VITGQYVNSGGVAHGFLRRKDGTITKFNAPHAGTSSGQGTFPLTNNPSGAIAGYFVDASGVAHGFIRSR
jgi:hypothetical protein